MDGICEKAKILYTYQTEVMLPFMHFFT